jgi:hypothetical protein
MAPVSELRDVTAALRVVAERQEKAKSRLNPIQNKSPVINTVVQLTLPSYVMPAIQLNTEKEVIAIGERALAPMSSTSVTNMFKNMKGNDHVERGILSFTEESPAKTVPETSLIVGATQFLQRLAPIPASII